MKNRRALQLLSVALGSVVLTALFLASRPPDVHQPAKTIDHLRELRHAEAMLGLFAVQARAGDLPAYDPVVAAAAHIDSLIDAIKQDLAGNEELSADFAAYAALSARRRDAVDRFLSANALFRNSLVFFPTFARELASRAHESGDTQLAAAIGAWETATHLTVYRKVGSADAMDLPEMLDTITDPALRRDVELLIQHSIQLLTSDRNATRFLGEVLALAERDVPHDITHEYTDQFIARQARAEWFAHALYAASFGAIVAILVLLCRLNLGRVRLQHLNGVLRQQRSRIRERESTFRLLFEGNPIPMWVYDRESCRFVAANKAAIGHYGWDRDEILGMSLQDIWSPEDRSRFRDNGPAAGGAQIAGPWQHVKADGTRISVDITAHDLRFQGRPCTLVAAVDMTEQRRAEEVLRASEAYLKESEKRFRDMVEATSDWFWETGPDHRYTYISPSFEERIGVALGSMVGRLRAEFADPAFDPDGWSRYLGDLEAKRPFRDAVYRFVRDGQKARYFKVSGIPIFDADGALKGYRGTGSDVTTIIEAEERERTLQTQLYHNQRLDSLGTLAGGIAHDLNNALVPVLTLAGFTAEQMPAGSVERENMEIIAEAAERASDLVKQILAFSRQETPERGIIDLAEVARDAFRMLRATLPTTIDFAASIDDVPLLDGDPGQLRQAIVNIVTNAAQAIGDAPGAIALTLSTVDAGHLDWADGEATHCLRLTVQDTGCGMDAATVERMFEPFFTTRAVGEGTGLGLAVVHGIVTSHGGRVEVQSAPDTGTRFDIFLPAILDGATTEAAVHAS